jgi:hypothetical protein
VEEAPGSEANGTSDNDRHGKHRQRRKREFPTPRLRRVDGRRAVPLFRQQRKPRRTRNFRRLQVQRFAGSGARARALRCRYCANVRLRQLSGRLLRSSSGATTTCVNHVPRSVTQRSKSILSVAVKLW